MNRRQCKHVICQPCLQHRQCLSCQSRERFCTAERIIQSYRPLLVSQTHHSAATHHHHRRCCRSCRTPEKCMHVEQIIIIFYICFFICCSMYLVMFSIVLYRTIVTVYTNNIFLYNYLHQMHQIIHLSLVGCFTPARGKTVQKNREVRGVSIKFILNNY